MNSVFWTESALNELTELWISSKDRAKITNAVSEIDRRLRRDPEHEGESRQDDRRILLESPLGVVFKTKPMDRMVVVLHVWDFETRGRTS